jgi:hypothetical protein
VHQKSFGGLAEGFQSSWLPAKKVASTKPSNLVRNLTNKVFDQPAPLKKLGYLLVLANVAQGDSAYVKG